ncbi:MAG: excinuclease ABC subunit UvrC [Actinobacteria bacterium]|nr:excinuclease ABC subunit UvrC [Actinomycetota bacterium]
MIIAQRLEADIRAAPNLPGVYLFRDEAGDVLYVGKALSLRKRLSSYLPVVRAEGPEHPSARMLEMGRRAAGVEWLVTTSESEALLLEHNFIRHHRPPFNIRLRDDKSYPYIVVTMADEFPRVMFTRAPHRKGNLYFGPYASAAKVRETLDALGRIFPFRKCRGVRPGRRSGTPCLQHAIRRCPAPCRGLVDAEEYRQAIDQVVEFLGGRGGQVVRRLEREMKEAAASQDFERAALYRDRLTALNHVLERQQARSDGLGSVDIIGMARAGDLANIHVFLTRDGVLADRRSFTLEGVEEVEDQEIFERFLGEYYGGAPTMPPEVVVPRSVGTLDDLASFLSQMRGTGVHVHHAERGDKRRLQSLADRNAALALEQERLHVERSREKRWEALTGLQAIFGLERPPLRIEGYDISHLGGRHIVASMVVFQGAAPLKSSYRRFAIQSLSEQDDVAAIREVVERRFQRYLNATNHSSVGQEVTEESGTRPHSDTRPHSGTCSRPGLGNGPAAGAPDAFDLAFATLPDLVIVDGGKGQLGAARSVLRAAGFEGVVSVASLAKREEEVFIPGRTSPIVLARDDPALLLLQRVRDEAHRFAVGFHRARRDAAVTSSVLDGLPGVGVRRKQAILKHFGSPEAFLAASREELEAVPGLPGKVARAVYDYVHRIG